MSILVKGNGITVIGPRKTPPSPLFKMTIDTTQPGSASDTFVLPLQNTTNNFVVDWGDGNLETVTTVTSVSHSYGVGNEGTYQITLDGSFSGINIANLGDKLKVSSIDNWGSNQWANMQSAFYGCSNMVANYSDAPDTSLVTDMTRVFSNCSLFNGLVSFDTSSVTTMDRMFANTGSFNQIVNFDGTSLLEAEYMFSSSAINSNVTITSSTLMTTCRSMFNFCSSFNSVLTLDTTSMTNMISLFEFCNVLNTEPVFSNTSSVTSMSRMFYNCLAYDKPVPFNTSSVNNMGLMFYRCLVFNQSVSGFDTSSVTNMDQMFSSARLFNQSVSTFNTLIVTSMSQMFRNAFVFNQDVSGFNISSLTNASSMFLSSAFSTANYNLLLPLWDAYGTSNVSFHAGTAHYSAGAPTTAHDAMVARGWTMTDGGTP